MLVDESLDVDRYSQKKRPLQWSRAANAASFVAKAYELAATSVRVQLADVVVLHVS